MISGESAYSKRGFTLREIGELKHLVQEAVDAQIARATSSDINLQTPFFALLKKLQL